MSITLTAKSQDELLDMLLKSEGLTYEEYVDKYGGQPTMTAICMEPDCHAVLLNRPRNLRHGECPSCGAHTTVHSGYVLMGMI
jgi:arginine/ornithine N-succinyltransferase beta subunit